MGGQYSHHLDYHKQVSKQPGKITYARLAAVALFYTEVFRGSITSFFTVFSRNWEPLVCATQPIRIAIGFISYVLLQAKVLKV